MTNSSTNSGTSSSPSSTPIFQPFALDHANRFKFIPVTAAVTDPPGTPIVTLTNIRNTAIQVNWTVPEGYPTSYTVEYQTELQGASWYAVSEYVPGDTKVTHTGLVSGETYNYRVRATNEAGNGDYGTASSATTTYSLPNAPSALTATSSNADSVSLSWQDNSSGTGRETGFEIQVSTNGGTTYSTLFTTSENVTTYTHTGRTESTQYYYKVRATNEAGDSGWSAAANVTTPAAITGFTATATSSTQIDLAWTDKSGVETGFRIERSTDNTNWSFLQTTSANATSYSNTGLSASTQYYYRIRSSSYNGTDNSAWYSANATTAGLIPSPTYEIDFTTDQYIGTKFSRASRATFIGSDGYIQAAEMNLLLYSDEFDNTAAGAWVTKYGCTINPNQVTAPNNSTTADSLDEDASTGRHAVASAARTVNASSTYTLSVYVKANNRNYCALNLTSTGGTGPRFTQVFNLTGSGSLGGTNTSGSPTGTAATITAVGNGWFRITATMDTVVGTTSITPSLCASDSATPTYVSNVPSYAGASNSAVYFWGAQLVAGTSPLPYVRTTTTAIGTPRITYDPVTLTNLGLLMEPAATNIALATEDLTAAPWALAGVTTSAGTGTAPDGGADACVISESGTTASVRNVRTASITTNVAAGDTFTASAFIKDSPTAGRGYGYVSIGSDASSILNAAYTVIINLSTGALETTMSSGSPTGTSYKIENYGNGWYRVSATLTSPSGTTGVRCRIGMWASGATNSSGSPSYAVTSGDERSILAWGAQIEEATTSSSYIPNTATSGSGVTRSADGWNIMSTEMATLWNQSQGSLVAKGRIYTPFTNGGLVRVGVGGSNANAYLTSVAASQLRPAIRVAAVNYNSGPTGSPTSGAVVNTGYSYNQATPAFTGFVGGTAGSTLTNSLSAVTIDKLEVGSRVESNMGSGTTYGTAASIYVIERLRYWNTALSNTDMTTLTAP